MPIPRKDVDLIGGDDFSRFCGAICRSTYDLSPYVTVVDYSRGHFRGPRSVRLNDKTGALSITLAPDGIGTKVKLNTVAGLQHRSAHDLFAMTGGDITRYGGARVLFANVLDVDCLGEPGSPTRQAFMHLALGLGELARRERVILLTGETAELGDFVGPHVVGLLTKYNWAGVMLGVYHPQRMILGDQIEVGHVVVALQERGFRSNGLTTVRGILSAKFGEEWWCRTDAAFQRFIVQIAEPSVLYDALLEDANGWGRNLPVSVTGIAHISGGGIPTKLGDLLRPHGFSAELTNLYEPPAIMQRCLDWGNLSHRYAYERWNGGQGVLVVMPERLVEPFHRRATAHGIPMQPCGRITASVGEPTITIHSKFRGGQVLEPFPIG